ncbi:Ig-like domain-containing protein, partial [Massilia sp. MS-15]|uniref:Ig-like domain-containing protein n=1 Tax=Massilia sp. MS-15 TaxID=2878200 RepID=UPI001CD4D83B
VTVTPVNDLPVAGNTNITTAEDTAKAGSLPAASDADGDTVTYAKVSDPAHGAVTIASDGTYTYTPAANYHGTDSFTYTVSDGRGGSNTYTVNVTVTPVNDLPVAGNTNITTAEDTAKAGSLPAASDADGDTVTYAKASDPAHGTVIIASDGTYAYMPAANYHGTDSFTYTVSDGQCGSNTYTVNVTVTPVNDLPVAGNTNITTAEDTATAGSLPAASDADGDTVTYAKASDPAHGVVTIASDGTYAYTPAANYHGTDSFSYTVSDGQGGSNTYTVNITVTPVNDLPVVGNSSITTAEDTARTGTLPAASDVDGDTLTYSKASDPAHGTVSIAADGTYTYTPGANYNGADSFTYTVSDGNGGSNTYTVNVTVTPVNDAPGAAPTTIITAEDTVIAGSLPAASDVDGDAVTYTKAANPAHGSLVIGADGSYTYAPDANYHGNDSFSYRISDGKGGSNIYTVEVNVAPVNDLPIAAGAIVWTLKNETSSGKLPAASDVDGDTITYATGRAPQHGTVSIDAGGNYSYTPARGYSGTDSFTFTVSDGQGGSNTYDVTVVVGATNEAPVGAGTSIVTRENSSVAGALPAATDADGDVITYAKAGEPAHGKLVIQPGGSYLYTPDAGFHGADSFSYTISDGQGGSNTYTVEVTVTALNRAPVAADASIATGEDTPVAGDLPRAQDANGDIPLYSLASGAGHGTVSVAVDGGYTYVPHPDFHGSDSFSYTVSDGKGGSNTYTVTVEVAPRNDLPVGADGTIATSEDTAVSGPLPTASDADGDTLTYAKASDPLHGSVTIGADGGYTYVPHPDYHGADSFRYTVSDGQGGSQTYTVTVTVTPANDAPRAAGASIVTREDVPVTGALPAASDADGDPVGYATASGPAHGRVSIGADGKYTYTPDANFHGSDSFSYTVSDGKGGSNTYTVDVTVTPDNQAPVARAAAIATREDTPVGGALPAATDADGDPVRYTLAANAGHGTVSVGQDGSYTYAPHANYHGSDSFSYTVSDGRGGSNTYTVTVEVSPVNDAPVAHGGASGSGLVGQPLVPVGVPAFTDVDSATISYSATLSDGKPLPSWMVFDPATRSVGGTPPAGSAGTYVLTVTGSDGELTAETSITLVVGNPSAPAQALGIAGMTRDTGASATDFVTNDGAAGRSVNGSLSAPLGRNEVVQVSFDGGLTWTVASTSGTAWTVNDSGSHDRNWTIQARVFDSASGLSGPGAQREVVLDTTAPGASAADSQRTGSTTPVLSGSATLLEGEKLRVTINGATYEVAAPGGAWTLDLATATPVAGSATPLVVGQSYTVTPVITDLAGNARTGSTGSVDVTPPLKPAEPVITPTEPPVLPPQLGEPAVPVVESPPLVIPPAGPEPRPVSESVAPGSVADGDSLRPGSGSGYRPLELSSTFDRRSAELSDVYTRSEGFRTVVARADDPALVLFQGVPDQFVETGTQLSLTVPADAFAHTQPKAVVRLSATLQDGRPLPTWIHFNGQTGQFTGEVPKGLKGELRIKLIARDMEGREAAALFRINVGSSVVAPDGKAAPLGKPGLSQQLRAAPPRAVPGRG